VGNFSHIDCFSQCEIVGLNVIQDCLYPCYTRTSVKSLPSFWGIYNFNSQNQTSGHLTMCTVLSQLVNEQITIPISTAKHTKSIILNNIFIKTWLIQPCHWCTSPPSKKYQLSNSINIKKHMYRTFRIFASSCAAKRLLLWEMLLVSESVVWYLCTAVAQPMSQCLMCCYYITKA